MPTTPTASEPPRASRGRSPAPVLGVFLLLAIVTQAPYLKAALAPPPGRAFVGTFHWVDDFYNYLSFVRQAEEGRFLFDSSVSLQPHEPILVNLEWWTVGRLSALLSGRPILAYRLFGLALTLVLLFGVDRWLVAGGLPLGHRLPALALVGVGGGLGGWLFELTDLPVSRCAEMSACLFPFFEALASPHFVAATALLVWALWYLADETAPRGALRGILLGSVLGLVRPYDMANLALIRTGAVLLTRRPGEGLRRLLPLAALAPVLAYSLWAFFASPAFSYHSERGLQFPPRVDFVPALGPGLCLALLCLASRPQAGAASALRLHLACWVGLGLLIVAVGPGNFLAQHLTGLGLPVLMLAALGLARFRPAATWLAAAALSFSSVVETRIVLADEPFWQVAAERLRAAHELRSSCRRGDLFLGPPDVGLYAMGLTSCRAVLSLPSSKVFREQLPRAREFYVGADPARRSAWLDELCVTHLALPGHVGHVPSDWLGPATPFRRFAELGGTSGGLSLYVRQPRGPCPTP